MLIDRFLPDYDFKEKHSINIPLSNDKVWEHLMNAEIGNDMITKMLLRLRGITPHTTQMKDFGKGTFAKLAEEPGREIIFGIVSENGRFSCCRPASPHDFEQPHPKCIRSIINFSLRREAENSVISTETRVLCGNDQLKKQFRRYWFFVQPFSGLIRRRMLIQLKKALVPG